MTQTYLAFLRGINVGGANLVKMADLKKLFEEEGFEKAQTVLQSGNAVFIGRSEDDQVLEERLTLIAAQRLGVKTEFFVKTLQEVLHLLAANPCPEEAESDPSHLLIHFLKSEADPISAAAVQSATRTGEKIYASGRQLFVYYPNGVGNSKLTSTPGWRELAGSGTARNWNTVQRMAAIARAL